ncbi:MAG: hypothetical protein R3C20_04470 [Planctomycetaceae bacterium]
MSMSTLLESFAVSLPARGVSKQLKDAVKTKDGSGLNATFKEECRRLSKLIQAAAPGEQACCLWSVDSVPLSGRERELAAGLEETGSRLSGKAKRRSQVSEVIANWLVEASCPLGAWELLTICELLIRHGHQLKSDLRLQCLALLLEQHDHQAGSGNSVSIPDDAVVSSGPFAHLEPLIAAESQLLLNLLVRPFINDTIERQEAASLLMHTMTECTDQDGIPQGSILNVLPHLLAHWTRTLLWGEVFGEKLNGKKVASRFHSVVEKSAMLLIPSPSLPGLAKSRITDVRAELAVCRTNAAHDTDQTAVSRSVSPDMSAVLAVSTRIGGFKSHGKVRSLLKNLNSVKSIQRARRQVVRHLKTGRFEENIRGGLPAWQSDTANVAIMRSSADVLADVCSVDYSSSTMQFVLATLGVPMMEGAWDSSLRVDDRELPIATGWECSCWYSDDEAAFIEMECKPVESCTVVRHLMITHGQRLAAITENVRTTTPDVKVQFSSKFTLANGWTTHRDLITRELKLTSSDVLVRAFPLWQPDDRIDHAFGTFEVRENQLHCSTQGIGGCSMPVVFDWNPRRATQPADWNRLTVAESRRIVGEHEANGYRLRVGSHQMLTYFSLTDPKLHRTVMGVHTPDESVYGQIDKDGKLLPYVQVEFVPED